MSTNFITPTGIEFEILNEDLKNLVTTFHKALYLHTTFQTIQNISKSRKEISSFIIHQSECMNISLMVILGEFYNRSSTDLLSFNNILKKYKIDLIKIGDAIPQSILSAHKTNVEKLPQLVIENIAKCYHHIYLSEKQNKMNEICKIYTPTVIQELITYAFGFVMMVISLLDPDNISNVELLLGYELINESTEYKSFVWNKIADTDFTFTSPLDIDSLFDWINKNNKL